MRWATALSLSPHSNFRTPFSEFPILELWMCGIHFYYLLFTYLQFVSLYMLVVHTDTRFYADCAILDRSTVKRRTRGKKINVFSPWVSAMKRAEISRVVSQVSLHFRSSLLECSADTAEFRCWYRLRSRKVSHALPFFFSGMGREFIILECLNSLTLKIRDYALKLWNNSNSNAWFTFTSAA